MLAYLISAYRDPEHLARLIKALDFNADFYVHIDANVDEAPFRAALPHKVKFVHRHAVNWGGWNQVAYQYELVKAAVSSGCNYSHLVCASAHRIIRFGATAGFMPFLQNTLTRNS